MRSRILERRLNMVSTRRDSSDGNFLSHHSLGMLSGALSRFHHSSGIPWARFQRSSRSICSARLRMGSNDSQPVTCR